ncbi:MAG: FMN-binding protein [Sporichthyaceae bacterium]
MNSRRLLIARNAATAVATAGAVAWLLRYPTSTVGAPAQSNGVAPATVEYGINELVKVTGPSVATPYGPVQVVVQWRDEIIDYVDAVVYPSSSPVDRAINEEAVPLLVGQTLTNQSAEVDTVSGATQTSEGYRTSLQAALDAKNAAPAENPNEHAGHASS